MWSRKVRSLTLCTSTPSTSRTASTSTSAWSASAAEQVTSTTRRSWLESATSMAVTMPPAVAIAVATAPTTPWSGAVWRRIVIEYDDGVADMLITLDESSHGTAVASCPEQDADEEHQGDRLRPCDPAGQGGPVCVVQPAREAAARQRRDRLERRERAVRRGQPRRRDQVCDQGLHGGVLDPGRRTPEQHAGHGDAGVVGEDEEGHGCHDHGEDQQRAAADAVVGEAG